MISIVIERKDRKQDMVAMDKPQTSNTQMNVQRKCGASHKPHMHKVQGLSLEAIAARLKIVEQTCIAKAMRFTPLRRQIYQLILQADKPVGAYDLLQSLQAARTKTAGHAAKTVAPPTVYRTLEFLLELGVIHQLTSVNAFVPCCHPRDHHNAVFLLCNQCHSVQECSNLPVQGVDDYVNTVSGFKVEHSVMELQGKCQQCMQGLTDTTADI